MAAIDDLLAYVVTVLQTVAGIGVLHRYEPIATDPSQLTAVFGASGSVKAWTISAGACQETRQTNIEVQRIHTLMLRLFYEVGDASVTEAAALALSEAAMVAWRPNVRYPAATGAEFELLSAMSRTRRTHTMLGGTLLCHVIEHTITAQEPLLHQ